MIRQANKNASQAAQRVRDEMSTAREHLLSAAEHSVERLGDASRKTRKEAQERARLAAKVLRGERPASPWRWLGLGLVAGLAFGAAAVATFRRWQEPVRERTSTVAHRAADAARDTAAKVRDAARDVTGQAGDSAEDVSQEARKRAEEVAREARAEARDVADTAREPAAANSSRGRRPRQDPDPSRPTTGGTAG